MNEKLARIIIAIVDRLVAPEAANETVESLTESLVEAGYSIGEINDAFMWLFRGIGDRFFEEGAIVRPDKVKRPIRLLSDFEKSIISPEAYGYILQLSQLGLLTDLQIEDLIERAIYYCSDRVELNDLKQLLPSVILEGIGGTHPGLISWGSGGENGSISH